MSRRPPWADDLDELLKIVDLPKREVWTQREYDLWQWGRFVGLCEGYEGATTPSLLLLEWLLARQKIEPLLGSGDHQCQDDDCRCIDHHKGDNE